MSPAEELFVVGSPRSGTTLVADILSQLPGVWIGKETGFVPHLYRPEMESIDEWDDRRLEDLVEGVNSYLARDWKATATVDGLRRFWSDNGGGGYSGLVRYVWSLGPAPDHREVTFAGDQSPAYVLALPLLEQLFPHACFVHVVRDPRDVVASILPLSFGAQSAGVAAADWNECVAGWWAAERRVPPERRCEVRYEDLVSAPGQTLQRLAKFLGVAVRDAQVLEVNPTDAHGLSENAPHHVCLAGPIDARSVGRHRRDLSDRERALVESITYAGMVTYGYDPGPFRPSPVLAEDAVLLTRERLSDLRRRGIKSVARRLRR